MRLTTDILDYFEDFLRKTYPDHEVDRASIDRWAKHLNEPSETNLAPCGQPRVPGYWFCHSCKNHYSCMKPT